MISCNSLCSTYIGWACNFCNSTLWWLLSLHLQWTLLREGDLSCDDPDSDFWRGEIKVRINKGEVSYADHVLCHVSLTPTGPNLHNQPGDGVLTLTHFAALPGEIEGWIRKETSTDHVIAVQRTSKYHLQQSVPCTLVNAAYIRLICRIYKGIESKVFSQNVSCLSRSSFREKCFGLTLGSIHVPRGEDWPQWCLQFPGGTEAVWLQLGASSGLLLINPVTLGPITSSLWACISSSVQVFLFFF